MPFPYLDTAFGRCESFVSINALVTLTGTEIGLLVEQIAPEWRPRLDEEALETAAEAGARNVRRVLTLLRQLYDDTAASSGPVKASAVEVAAEKGRQAVTEAGRPPDVVLEEAVRAAGGHATREEAVLGRLRFDIVARLGEDTRLVADIKHVSTAASLRRMVEDFVIGFDVLRRRHPAVRGALIVSGAVDQAALDLLRPVSGVEALHGDGPAAEAAIRRLVTTAMTSGAAQEARSTPAEEVAARDRIREEREERKRDADATQSRLKELEFGETERGAAAAAMAREAVPTAAPSSFGPEAQVLDSFSDSMRSQDPSLFTFFFSPAMVPALVLGVFGLLALMILSSKPEFFGTYPSDSVGNPNRILDMVKLMMLFGLVLFVLMLGVLLYHERRAYLRYRRLGQQVLEEMIVMERPSVELLRMKNRLVDAPDASGGFRSAVRWSSAS